MTIGENIKALRERRSMTQAELGNLVGVSDKAVSTWENGTAEPRMGTVEKLAKAFGVKKTDLIDGDMHRITQPDVIVKTDHGDIMLEVMHMDKEYQEMIYYYLKGVLGK